MPRRFVVQVVSFGRTGAKVCVSISVLRQMLPCTLFGIFFGAFPRISAAHRSTCVIAGLIWTKSVENRHSQQTITVNCYRRALHTMSTTFFATCSCHL